MRQQHQPCLFVTPGEPAGVGPDLLLRLAATSPPPGLVAVADPKALQLRAKLIGVNVEFIPYDHDLPWNAARPGALPVWSVPLPHPDVCHVPNPENSPALLRALQVAADACRQGKGVLVTGPLQKSAMVVADKKFNGHTGYLADLCKCKNTVMLFVGDNIKLALATVHLPLADVSRAINRESLVSTIMLLEHGLGRWFNMDSPRIRVLGLNPHAGEDGLLGNEEIQAIKPAIIEARRRGAIVTGPVAADTAFVNKGNSNDHDVTLSMYHDQALPAVKALAFGKLANVTLGLPFLRTSVDHGTALSRAGTDDVRHDSFEAAVQVALDCAARQRQFAMP